jgi:hypothetical protein
MHFACSNNFVLTPILPLQSRLAKPQHMTKAQSAALQVGLRVSFAIKALFKVLNEQCEIVHS